MLTRAIETHEALEALTSDLSIVTFRYVPTDLRTRRGEAAVEEYLSRLNKELLDDLQRGGELFVSNAVLSGSYVLRACIVNFNTSEEDVLALPEIVARRGQVVDSTLRKAANGPR